MDWSGVGVKVPPPINRGRVFSALSRTEEVGDPERGPGKTRDKKGRPVLPGRPLFRCFVKRSGLLLGLFRLGRIRFVPNGLVFLRVLDVPESPAIAALSLY